MIHIDLCHSIPTLSQRYKLRVVAYEDDYDKIMEVYQSLGTKFDFLIGAFNSNPIISFASFFGHNPYIFLAKCTTHL